MQTIEQRVKAMESFIQQVKQKEEPVVTETQDQVQVDLVTTGQHYFNAAQSELERPAYQIRQKYIRSYLKQMKEAGYKFLNYTVDKENQQ